MNSYSPFVTRPTTIKTPPFLFKSCNKRSNRKRGFQLSPNGVNYPLGITRCSRINTALPSEAQQSYLAAAKMVKFDTFEEDVEKVIYRCRFLAILGVLGSLVGSVLCFIKGCTYVVSSFMQFFVTQGRVILLLVEAIDVYLLGTVMLVFGMGLYELFISNLDIAKSTPGAKELQRSNLFGLFTLKERPQWLEVKSVNDLKTRLGHVIVMLLLIGFFEKSKTAVIYSPLDLLCFSASVFLCAGCLYLLSKLSD